MTERTGLRFDVRHFRAVGAPDGPLARTGASRLSFWRARQYGIEQDFEDADERYVDAADGPRPQAGQRLRSRPPGGGASCPAPSRPTALTARSYAVVRRTRRKGGAGFQPPARASSDSCNNAPAITVIAVGDRPHEFFDHTTIVRAGWRTRSSDTSPSSAMVSAPVALEYRQITPIRRTGSLDTSRQRNGPVSGHISGTYPLIPAYQDLGFATPASAPESDHFARGAPGVLVELVACGVMAGSLLCGDRPGDASRVQGVARCWLG